LNQLWHWRFFIYLRTDSLKAKKINEAHAAFIGAIIAIIFLLKPHQVLEALGISTQEMLYLLWLLDVVIILITLMIISVSWRLRILLSIAQGRRYMLPEQWGQAIFIYLSCGLFHSAFAGNDLSSWPQPPLFLFCKMPGSSQTLYVRFFFCGKYIFNAAVYRESHKYPDRG